MGWLLKTLSKLWNVTILILVLLNILGQSMKKILYLFYYLLAGVLIFYLIKSIADDGLLYTICGLMDSGRGSWCD